MTLLGLFFIALGSGGIKPCVAAFGGDQFKLPEQAKQVATFFSLFYFSINAGSLISSSITPILRQDVNCFGDDTCYSLAFGVPGILMCISIVIFIAGKFLYKVVPPAGNVVVLVTKCIGVRLSLCISWYLRSIYNVFIIVERCRNPLEGIQNQQERPLAGLFWTKIRQAIGSRHKDSSQHSGSIHSASIFLGALRPKGFSLDVPGSSNGWWRWLLHL